jgi:hypothetical protein
MTVTASAFESNIKMTSVTESRFGCVAVPASILQTHLETFAFAVHVNTIAVTDYFFPPLHQEFHVRFSHKRDRFHAFFFLCHDFQ